MSGGRSGGTIYNSSDVGGTIKWVESMGQTSPVLTNVPGEKKDDQEGAGDIYELAKAREEMKPILVFFAKPKDLLAFGSKSQKDPEVDACESMDQDLWKRLAITERSKEFVCVRVNVRKADPKLLAKYRVARSPVVSIFDYNLKEMHFSANPKISWNAFGKVMETIQTRVEGEVKKLAASKSEEAPVPAAKKRAQVIEQRELYDAGLEFLDKKKWDEAEAKFNKANEIAQDSEWKKQAQVGLVEIKAGKMLDEADKLYTQRQFKECKNLCDKILKECKEAKFFNGLVQELKTKVEKKLS